MPKCEVCFTDFENSKRLSAHRRIHNKVECKWQCGFPVDRESNIVKHELKCKNLQELSSDQEPPIRRKWTEKRVNEKMQWIQIDGPSLTNGSVVPTPKINRKRKRIKEVDEDDAFRSEETPSWILPDTHNEEELSVSIVQQTLPIKDNTLELENLHEKIKILQEKVAELKTLNNSDADAVISVIVENLVQSVVQSEEREETLKLQRCLDNLNAHSLILQNINTSLTLDLNNEKENAALRRKEYEDNFISINSELKQLDTLYKNTQSENAQLSESVVNCQKTINDLELGIENLKQMYEKSRHATDQELILNQQLEFKVEEYKELLKRNTEELSVLKPLAGNYKLLQIKLDDLTIKFTTFEERLTQNYNDNLEKELQLQKNSYESKCAHLQSELDDLMQSNREVGECILHEYRLNLEEKLKEKEKEYNVLLQQEIENCSALKNNQIANLTASVQYLTGLNTGLESILKSFHEKLQNCTCNRHSNNDGHQNQTLTQIIQSLKKPPVAIPVLQFSKQFHPNNESDRPVVLDGANIGRHYASGTGEEHPRVKFRDIDSAVGYFKQHRIIIVIKKIHVDRASEPEMMRINRWKDDSHITLVVCSNITNDDLLILQHALINYGLIISRDHYEEFKVINDDIIVRYINESRWDFDLDDQGMFRLVDCTGRLTSKGSSFMTNYLTWKSHKEQFDSIGFKIWE